VFSQLLDHWPNIINVSKLRSDEIVSTGHQRQKTPTTLQTLEDKILNPRKTGESIPSIDV
jgi:hypothetical protein